MLYGHEIFQIDLHNPRKKGDEDTNPVAWTLMGSEAKVVCDYLNDRYDGLYFFITEKG
jgi:hypothetical protein